MAYTTIDKPSDYFETVTYAGGTTDISSLDFQPDWVWGKKRDGTESHGLFDSVRGATKDLRSDSNAVESTRSGSLTSFDNDGFTMGGSDGIISNSGSTYVAWCWRAGTSFTNDASSTSVGSIDSAGSVNTDAGFSIIGYTGDAQTGTTIAHGLGVKPNMIILKNREPDISNWQVYHSSLGATHYVQLNSTGAATDSNTRWNDVEPTSTVFTTGSSGDVKGDNSGETFIAYCFAEKQGYSKFGTYTGNGNADGTFFYTGFKPKFVIFKRSSGTGNWQLLDNKRLGYNVENHTIYPNSNIAEQDETDGDILSNGFKLRNTGTDGNGSGSTYIYMAFANNPFVTSTGIPTTAE